MRRAIGDRERGKRVLGCRTPRRARERRRGRAGASLLILVLLSIGVCGWLRRSFDSERWRAAAPGSGLRSDMARSLVSSQRLSGLSSKDVLALLGPSDNGLQEPRAPVRWYDLVYLLGGDDSSSEWLVVDVDEHDTVVETSIGLW